MNVARPVSLAASLVFCLGTATAQASYAPAVGEVFPEMAFPTLDGGSLASLKDFRGKRVLLMQFASW